MNDDTSTEALRYLLDEMDEVRRAAFEASLERDPVATAEFKRTADSLAGFALATAPTATFAAEERVGLASAVLAAAQPVAKQRARGRRLALWAWPIAAALLLGLNLWQFFAPPGMGRALLSAARGDGAPARPAGQSLAPQGIARVAAASAAAESGAKSAAVTTAPARARAPRDGERLRAELSALQRSYDSLEVERRALSTRLSQMAHAAGSGIVAMELVDPERFAKGERRGLVALLQSLSSDPLDGPIVVGRDGMSVAAVGVIATTKSVGADAPLLSATPPSAWSIFDAAEHEGLVNLFNLPEVPDDELLALWVKSGDGDSFRLVGELPPALYGGSGTVFVTLDPHLATPAEVLVTREKRGEPTEVPGATTVLRGP
ncbi:MAG TPA: hypothetical protein VK178_12055 [Opitutaceae bacterium]|nr:hypothetical protein [Opitutaceae bacterium]